jgi:cation diffusion facilitator CzcD-associated flavoprotein CzcO
MASQNGTVLELDAVIVGAGFSGIYTLLKLRDELGLNVKIIDAGSDLGGTWHWNTYPGARVDCPAPTYGFGIEEVWKSWNWSEVYPGQQEIQSYFGHVDKVLSVRKDCIFNSRVISAHFNPAKAKWTIRTDDGRTAVAQHFVPAVGFATKQYIPAWKGVELFEGIIHHSSLWPKEGVDVRGKRVAIIGTGSTGVQIIQEWAKEAAETHVFQRTPNLCLPMDQMKLDSAAQHNMQAQTGDLFARSRLTGGGLPDDGPSKMFSEFSFEDCENAVNQLYDQGGFRLWAGAYKDLLLNSEANRVTYDIWAKRTRQRIQDPVKRDLLAPLEPPHPFGTKRPSLEQDYYEQFNKPNVHIVDTKTHPIVELTPRGIMTEDGKVYEVDVIAIATGFDASTGSLGEMGICDVNGIDLGTRWSKEAVSTFLGLMVSGFPNMFLPYSVQAPTPFTNGPVFIEFQAEFIRDIIRKMKVKNIQMIDARPTAAQGWRDQILKISEMTLLPEAKSWYMGANIPGKRVELLYFYGGIPAYRGACENALTTGFEESFFCHH